MSFLSKVQVYQVHRFLSFRFSSVLYSHFYFGSIYLNIPLAFQYFCFHCIYDLVYQFSSKYIVYIFIDFGSAELFLLSLFIIDLKTASQLPCCHQYYEKIQTSIIGSIFHNAFFSRFTYF